jgi:hypothetical protein
MTTVAAARSANPAPVVTILTGSLLLLWPAAAPPRATVTNVVATKEVA